MTVKITTRPNGPYLVEGEIELLDPTGATINTTGQARIALCRCGASVNKPLCDGTHNKIGFQAAEPPWHRRRSSLQRDQRRPSPFSGPTGVRMS